MSDDIKVEELQAEMVGPASKYDSLSYEKRRIVDEAFKAMVASLRSQGAINTPMDLLAEDLVDLLAAYVERCEFR